MVKESAKSINLVLVTHACTVIWSFTEWINISPHVTSSKIVLDPGFHTVDSAFLVSGTWIPDSNC